MDVVVGDPLLVDRIGGTLVLSELSTNMEWVVGEDPTYTKESESGRPVPVGVDGVGGRHPSGSERVGGQWLRE